MLHTTKSIYYDITGKGKVSQAVRTSKPSIDETGLIASTVLRIQAKEELEKINSNAKA